MKEILVSRMMNIYKRLAANHIKLDMILLRNKTSSNVDINFFYYTGLESGVFENTVLFLYPTGEQKLLTATVEEPSCKRYKFDLEVTKSRVEIDTLLKDFLKPVKKVGINGEVLSYKDVHLLKKYKKNIKLVDISKYLNAVRAIKDSLEIQYLRKSAKICMKVSACIEDFMRLNMSEHEVVAEANYLLQKHGSQGVAFDTIAAFGSHSAEPHAVPTAKKLRKGFVGVLDFGAKYNRYCTDITRTFVAGRASKYCKEAYEVVGEAQQKAFELLRAGVDGKEVCKKVENFINRTKFKNKFIHGLGHGIGLSVHEYGFLSSTRSFKLVENMAFTVEPGIYIKDWGGIRLEDDVLIKKNGIELLTKPQHKIIEI